MCSSDTVKKVAGENATKLGGNEFPLEHIFFFLSSQNLMHCVGLDKCLFDKCLCSNPLHWSESSKSILNYFEPIWMQSWRIYIIPLFKMITCNSCVDTFFWFSIVLRIILTFIYWCAKRSNTKRVPCWRLYLRESDQITLRLSGPSVSYRG